MFVQRILLKNFRCFGEKELTFDNKFVLLQADNGVGKTSLLEALYYSCYLKSFRTRISEDLVNFDKDYFFINLDFLGSDLIQNQVQVGYNDKEGKLVKFNNKPISCYKDLISQFKIISLTSEDIFLVQGEPEYRRAYLDQSICFINLDFLQQLKKVKNIVLQRNSFIKNSLINGNFKNNLIDMNQLYSWTKQLWQETILIQNLRINYLEQIEQILNNLLKTYYQDLSSFYIKLDYVSKNLDINQEFKTFWEIYKKDLYEKEFKLGRTLFGPHIDDFSIIFKDKKARIFASRGQQKLILFLLKISQLKYLNSSNLDSILLLDDFLTDFDENRIENSLTLLQDLDKQYFLTIPSKTLKNASFFSKKQDFSLIFL